VACVPDLVEAVVRAAILHALALVLGAVFLISLGAFQTGTVARVLRLAAITLFAAAMGIVTAL
jgi:hypothetical protein